jgi:hypothetical protein
VDTLYTVNTTAHTIIIVIVIVVVLIIIIIIIIIIVENVYLRGYKWNESVSNKNV